MQDASALRAVRSICAGEANADTAQVVVLSATAGTTDLLFSLARVACLGNLVEMHEALQRLRDKHMQILADAGVGASAEVEATLHELSRYANGVALLGECTAQSLDMMASFGEMLSTKIFVAMCSAVGHDATWFDVRTVIRTDTRFTCAAAQFDAIQPLADTLLKPLLSPGAIVVTQGYIGQTDDGRTTTLGRGGSDYSAAILGSVLDADEIQIWTDVSGVYSADPRQIPEAHPIPFLSFSEVRELALYGAKVLHPDAISPAIERSIPVRILNTFRPSDAGTLITAAQPDDSDIHAVTVLRACVRVVVHSSTAKSATLQKLADQSVLHMSSLDAHVFVMRIADEEARVSLDVALADVPHQAPTSVSIITACGPQASTARTLARISAAVRDAGADVGGGTGDISIMTGPNALSVFIVCRDEDVSAILSAVHSLSVSAASSSRH